MSGKVSQLGKLKGPLLIFGGPYSNLQASLAIKEVSERLNIPASNTICTGDIVAYCGEPFETLELVKDWGVHVVKGNCEESFASDAPDCGCGFEEGTTCSLLSVGWYRFALRKIKEKQKSWMSELPSRIELTYQNRAITIVHGGLTQTNRFIFPTTPVEEIQQELDFAKADIVIGGHSGIPFGQQLGCKAWLNSGAIGMPANDGTRDGWYLLLDSEGESIKASWHRLSYDAKETSETMQTQGLCGDYQETLTNGLWPSMDVLPGAMRERQGIPLVLEDLII